ncbi:unnamed protein product [Closterium sp. NIES-54]
MDDQGVDARVEDTLQARLDAVRACHDGGGYSEADLEILFLGTRAQWAREHPPPHAEADGASASPRPVHNEGDGSNVAQVLRSTAAADSSNGNKNGRRHSPQRSGVRPISATRVSAGRDRGIVPAYGYFNFSPNKIAVPKLLEGRNDLITWTESLEPKLEIAGLKKFVDENVLAPDEEDVELWSEFRMAHLWTFMVISRCCSPLVQVALKSCRLRVDAGYQAWQYIMRTYKATDDLYISQPEKKLTKIPPRAAPGGPLVASAAQLAAPCGPLTAPCCRLPCALHCPASPRSACYATMASLHVLGTAQALYDAVFARYSLPATAALGLLLLPYLFPKLSSFATVEDLVSHLRTSHAPYCAALPAEFLDRNPPPMYITLYFIVTRLPDSLHSVRDHFLSLDPIVLTVDLLEQHLLVGAARGTPRTPFFDGCSPSPLAPSYTSAAAVDVPSAEDIGAASASAKHRSSKGKGGTGGGGGSRSGGGGSNGRGGSSGGGGGSGSGSRSGGFGGSGGGSGGSGGSGSCGSGGGRTGAQHGGSRGGQRHRQQRRSETPSPQKLREWLFQRGASGGSVSCPYVIRMGDHAGQTCGRPHAQHCYFSRLDDTWRAEFGDEVERPHRAELLRTGVAIFDLDYDAILSALFASAEGDCYRCVPPNPGVEDAALGASESSLPSTEPAEALHTFTLDSGASRYFFRDSTTLTPLHAPVPVRLANPSGGPVVARSSTVLPCPAVAPPCSCRLLSHQTLLWHHRLGHPSLPRLRGMHSCLLVSGLRKSLPPLLPSPAPPCLPCHSSLLVSPDNCAPADSPYGLRLQLGERFGQDLPILRLHSDRGGEFSSNLLRDFCHGEGITQSCCSDTASGGAAFGGAEPGGAESEGAGSGGAEPAGVEPGGAELAGTESEGAESGGAVPRAARAACLARTPSECSCRSWSQWRPGDTGAGGAGVTAGAGGTRGNAAAGPGGACTRGTAAAGVGGVGDAGVEDPTEPRAAGAGGTGAEGTGAGGAGAGVAGAGGTSMGGTGARGAGAVDPRAGGAGAGGAGGTGAGGTVRPRPYFVPLLQQPASLLPAPSHYSEQSGSHTERREPASRPVSLVHTAHRIPRSHPPLVPGTHAMALRPSSVPLGVSLPPLPESSVPAVLDPKSDLVRAASPTVSRLLATVVTDPSFESTAAPSLVAELVDFAAACRLDYATALVAESESASPPSVGGECALGTDVLEDKQEDFECLAAAVPRSASMLLAPEGDLDVPDIPTPRSYAEAITGPYSSQWQAAMDAEMASSKSTGTYVDAVPPSGANIVDGMWIFRVKRPPGSPPAFKARYVARGYS